MFDVLIHITSDHVNFVDAVDYRGGVTTGDFGLRISEKTRNDIIRKEAWDKLPPIKTNHKDSVSRS